MKSLCKIILIISCAAASFYHLGDSPDYANYALHSAKDIFVGFQTSSYLYYLFILTCSYFHISSVHVLWLLNWIPLTVVLLKSHINLYFVFTYLLLFSWIWHTVQLRQGAILWLIILLLISGHRQYVKIVLALLVGRFWHKVSFLFVYLGKMNALNVLVYMLIMFAVTISSHPLNTINMFTLTVFLGLLLLVWNKSKIRLTLPLLLTGYFLGAYFDIILASRCLELSLLLMLVEISILRARSLMMIPFVVSGIFFYYG